MKCKHESCNGLMEQQHDRYKCLICGRSEWRDFGMRKPLKAEMRSNFGPEPGTRANGSDNITARI